MRPQTAALTVLALIAFAANSILTRMALGRQLLDAASFTSVRLLSGALVLMAVARWQTRGRPQAPAVERARGWTGAFVLFAYAAPFSFAYLRIGAAVGALVLFGAVQLTMVGWGMLRGDRPALRTVLGGLIAFGGLSALTLPGASRPDSLGIALMVVAGMAWGIYSLLGKGAADPVAANARNFLRAVPLALLVSVSLARVTAVTGLGLVLAILSGALASGLGYAIWYRALRGLAVSQAAVVQLSVPIIAAIGAVFFLDEPLGIRLIGSGLAVLGGVALALSSARRS